jgi:hypothetical protein
MEANPAPSDPAYFYYTNFDDPGASHEPHQLWSTHSGWEDQATYEQGEPSTSTGWGTFPTQEPDNTRQDFQRGRASFFVCGNTDHTTGGPYPFHAPPADEYMRSHEQYFGASFNDYSAMSLHLTNLQQGQQAMNDTLRRHEQWKHHIDDRFQQHEHWQHQADQQFRQLHEGQQHMQTGLEYLIEQMRFQPPPPPHY